MAIFQAYINPACIVASAILLFSDVGFSQTVSGKKANEIIVGVPALQPAQFSEVEEKISSLPGVAAAYSCQVHKCFFVKYKNGSASDFSQIENAVHQINKNLSVLQKQGTFEDFKKLCWGEYLKQQ